MLAVVASLTSRRFSQAIVCRNPTVTFDGNSPETLSAKRCPPEPTTSHCPGTGSRVPESWMLGLDAEHNVRGVSVVNLRFNGQRLQTAQGAHLRLLENSNRV